MAVPWFYRLDVLQLVAFLVLFALVFLAILLFIIPSVTALRRRAQNEPDSTPVQETEPAARPKEKAKKKIRRRRRRRNGGKKDEESDEGVGPRKHTLPELQPRLPRMRTTSMNSNNTIVASSKGRTNTKDSQDVDAVESRPRQSIDAGPLSTPMPPSSRDDPKLYLPHSSPHLESQDLQQNPFFAGMREANEAVADAPPAGAAAAHQNGTNNSSLSSTDPNFADKPFFSKNPYEMLATSPRASRNSARRKPQTSDRDRSNKVEVNTANIHRHRSRNDGNGYHSDANDIDMMDPASHAFSPPNRTHRNPSANDTNNHNNNHANAIEFLTLRDLPILRASHQRSPPLQFQGPPPPSPESSFRPKMIRQFGIDDGAASNFNGAHISRGAGILADSEPPGIHVTYNGPTATSSSGAEETRDPETESISRHSVSINLQNLHIQIDTSANASGISNPRGHARKSSGDQWKVVGPSGQRNQGGRAQQPRKTSSPNEVLGKENQTTDSELLLQVQSLRKKLSRRLEWEPALLFMAEILAVKAKAEDLDLHGFGTSLGLDPVMTSNIIGRHYGNPPSTLTTGSRIFQLLRRWEEQMEHSTQNSLKPLVDVLRGSGLVQEADMVKDNFPWLVN